MVGWRAARSSLMRSTLPRKNPMAAPQNSAMTCSNTHYGANTASAASRWGGEWGGGETTALLAHLRLRATVSGVAITVISFWHRLH